MTDQLRDPLKWPNPSRQAYVRKFALVYCLVTLSFSAFFTPQDFNLKVSVIVNGLLFFIGSPFWFRNTRVSPYWLNVLSQIGNAGASVWICSFLGPTSHINLVAIPQFIMALMMFSGSHNKTTLFSGVLCVGLLSLPLFPFVDTWYLHKRMPEGDLKILRELMDLTIFAFCAFQFRIITEAWAKLLQESETQRLRYQHQNNWRKRLLHILSHDVKEPVVQSLVAVRNLKRKLNPEKLSLANTIESAQLSIKEMITNIELTNSDEEGQFDTFSRLPVTTLSVRDVMERLLPWFESRLSEKGLTLNLTAASDSHTITAPADLFIYQLFMNLLSNAVKFAPVGSAIVLETRKDPSGIVRWILMDSGMGIQPTSFNPGNAIQTGTIGERGSGLGLQIVRTFAASAKLEVSWYSPHLPESPTWTAPPEKGTWAVLSQKLPHQA